MIVLVTGDRDWKSWSPIILAFDWLETYAPDPITLIHGAARGADSMAGWEAGSRGWTVRDYPARWDTEGRAAGPLRNQRMLDNEPIDVCLAFHDSLSTSKGTLDMTRRTRKASIPTWLVTNEFTARNLDTDKVIPLSV